MSKTVEQLTETTTAEGVDLLHLIDVSASQDLKMKKANFHNSKPYASMYMSANGTSTTVAAGSTYYNITTGGVTILLGQSNKFTYANGKMTYTGDEDIVVAIDLTLSATVSTTSSKAFFVIYINGVRYVRIESGVFITTGSSNLSNVAANGFATLSKDDYVEVFLINSTGAHNILVGQLSCTIKQV